MHVCIDGRRMDHGGIGRVTKELQRALVEGDRADCKLSLLVNGERAQAEPGVRLLSVPAPFLSLSEHRLLPEVLAQAGIDLFVTPQFYTTSKLPVPLVSWVHDTWPIRHPHWLPPPDEVFADKSSGSSSGGAASEAREGQQVARSLMGEYLQLRAAGQLFPNNRLLATRDEDPGSQLAHVVLAMYALNLLRSRRVITVTQHGYDDIVSLFPEVKERVRVVYNPIPSLPTHFPTELGADQSRRIVHVSKWEPRKNIPALIDAFALLANTRPSITLELVGAPVVESEARAIHARIAASGVAERISVHGTIDDAALQRLYQSAALLVVPSLFEGFSLPLVEAMAVGLPIAAARSGAIPEVVRDAGELFDPSDRSDMARAMAKILDDDVHRRKLVGAARARVETLRQGDFAGNILQVLREAID